MSILLKKRKRPDNLGEKRQQKSAIRPPSLVFRFSSCSFRVFCLSIPKKGNEKSDSSASANINKYVDENYFDIQRKILRQFFEKIEAFLDDQIVDFPPEGEKLAKKKQKGGEQEEGSGSSHLSHEPGQSAAYRAASTDDDATSSAEQVGSVASPIKTVPSTTVARLETEVKGASAIPHQNDKPQCVPMVLEAFITLPALLRQKLLAPEKLISSIQSLLGPVSPLQNAVGVSLSRVGEECGGSGGDDVDKGSACIFRDDGTQIEDARCAAELHVETLQQEIFQLVNRMFPVPKSRRSFASWRSRATQPPVKESGEESMSPEEFRAAMIRLEYMMGRHRTAV
eukprot:CAMPEP_0113314098 /NCGR_PEP_ID=MMETSP0010_2-20120614/10284_1 /TAXON_ID=216773 ORGANISM="Corethron hystrix, Strain 308" /NCGR_SAMPLE_ID=MMETSP0010_2 /ASSEMBLY_ACC=CAM_ASM_000155 /LENGTH=339 /DNA_ID=CAMNT_0000170295 /DNA_START=212 /DNA_END=1228 /DNA_ORIENTATION=+ /assembly_acc=CAM_ASM_000155